MSPRLAGRVGSAYGTVTRASRGPSGGYHCGVEIRERTIWRSPLRGPWLTAALGLALLVPLVVVIVTGLLSYAAYEPNLPGNDATPGKELLGFYLFDWPTDPPWLYRLTQGAHVALGIALVPVVLAKLWSVIPKLFELPPVRSIGHALERASLLLLVGGIVFEFVTGILNIQVFYVFPFSFYTAHLYGAWVFIGAFVAHVLLKFPTMVRSLRARPVREVLATSTADTRPDPDGPLVATDPSPPTMSRRGAAAFVGAASATLFGLYVGQTLDGPLRRTALFAPHDRDLGEGANAFPVNKTAETAGVTRARADAWRLELAGPSGTQRFTRADLAALPQHTYDLPIACVEGWSISCTWTGVRLADLVRLAGGSTQDRLFVESFQAGGAFGQVSLSVGQSQADESLLALFVGGEELSLDHGYPARTIIPAAPGVHATKWVGRLTVVTA
ncbi:molybdopterin-dependent oxidoreductase [Pseudonocardia sp. KRD-169]|uniref:Molybdopterin-dependent oxidoreductase n=1 Tax=Pseudonocardia abyssalis TaxID=2792008 RepID=A0ABS6UZE7_9PSEU|nr:molybdopterin-dependent oxidoreductase [Pseudonocardia abyssalis]MBW0137632.1 molybdopterin-dependent oxidoreductase [Pseudonocardia abyssalis]